MSGNDFDPEVLSWLLEDQKPQWRKNSTNSTSASTARPPHRTSASGNLDEELRQLGVPRPRREALRRGDRSNQKLRPVNKQQAIKRFDWYINEIVGDWSKTDLDRREVVAEWAELVHHDVEQARSWWNKGIDPLQIRQIKELASHSIQLRDLIQKVRGKTLLEHLADGQSPTWCVQAVAWERRDSNTW
ncbi:hypothetical protein [Nonomuraea dietziae]|uniref:hypothetical protein n=1 Tax=Nonomuraea dietziae TaxID=65515 RepID=UPI0033F10EF4